MRAHPAVNNGFNSLVVDWRKARGKHLPWRWPKHATPPKHLSMTAKTGSHDLPTLEQAAAFLSKHAVKAKTITSLHLRAWNMDDDGSCIDDIPPLPVCLSHLPQLTSLHFESCCGFDDGPARSLASVHNLQSLTFQDMHLDTEDWSDDGSVAGMDTAMTCMLLQLSKAVSRLQHLTRLSITCCGKHQTEVYVSQLGHIRTLRFLELAMPAEILRGMEKVAAGCSQLTHLHLVHLGVCMPELTADERQRQRSAARRVRPNQPPDDGHQQLRDDDRCAWPALVEAHVVVHCAELDKLGLLSAETAPVLQRLYLQAYNKLLYRGWKQTDFKEDEFTPLVGCKPLQQPLVLHNATPAAIASLAPLADKLEQLVLVRPRWGSEPDIATAIRQLPHLRRLSIDCPYAPQDSLEKLLSAYLGSVQHVVLGIGSQHETGNGWFVPENKQAKALEGVLRKLTHTQPSTSTEGRGRGGWRGRRGGRGWERGGRASRGQSKTGDTPAAAATPATPSHVHFGCWWPARRIHFTATQQSFAYRSLRELSRISEEQQAARLLHEHGSASTISSNAAQTPGIKASVASQSACNGKDHAARAGGSTDVSRTQDQARHHSGVSGSSSSHRAAARPVSQCGSSSTQPAASAATAPQRLVIHEAPNASAADLALGSHAWLQTQLEHLEMLIDVHEAQMMDSDGASSGSYDYNYLNHVYGGMGYEDGIPLAYMLSMAPLDDIFGY